MFVPSSSWQIWSVVLVGGCMGEFVGCAARLQADESKVPVTFSGGHDIDRQKDFGSATILIAAALGVKQDIFREAFGGVTPVHGGPPSGQEACKDKQALTKVLAPHGITNDRLRGDGRSGEIGVPETVGGPAENRLEIAPPFRYVAE